MGRRTGYAFLNLFWSLVLSRLQYPAFPLITHSQTLCGLACRVRQDCWDHGNHWWVVWIQASDLQSGRPDSHLGRKDLEHCHFSILMLLFSLLVWCVCVCRQVSWQESGGQRIALRNPFSPSTVWSAGLGCHVGGKHYYRPLAASLAFCVLWKPTMCTISYFAWFFK